MVVGMKYRDKIEIIAQILESANGNMATIALPSIVY
jgi:predicted transcriptional regulator